MSPRPEAPSSASISACVTTSPSEWPARPGSPGKSTPQRTSGTPGSKAWASTPRPTLIRVASRAFGSHRLEQPLDRLEICRLRDLEETGIAGHRLDSAARGLDEGRAIGGVVRPGDRRAEGRRKEGLWRLGGDERRAVDRLDHPLAVD